MTEANTEQINTQNKEKQEFDIITQNEFIEEFCKAIPVKTKKMLVNTLIKSEPEIKIVNLLNKLKILTDQKWLLKYYTEINEKSSIFNKISILNKKSRIETKIKKEAQNIYRKATIKNRKGRKFDGLILGGLSPYINNNDQYVVNEVINKLNNISNSSSIKKVYSKFITNLQFSLKIIHSIKNSGISTKNIEYFLNLNEKEILKEGTRTVLLNTFYLDNNFSNYKDKIKEIITGFSRDINKKFKDESGIYSDELSDLRNEKNIDIFAEKADKLLGDNIEYFDLINKSYENLLNDPLLIIFKTLKFPINRELFKNWVVDTPLLYDYSLQFKDKLDSLKSEIENKETDQIKNYEDLIKLIYQMDICFTNKYKTLSDISKKYEKTEPLKHCLRNIKDVQFKIETSIINILVTSIKNVFSRSEIESIFEKIMIKVEDRIKEYKELFKKNYHKYFNTDNPDIKKILTLLMQNVSDEKYIEIELMLEINKIVNTKKELFRIMKLSNFFVAYYLTLNCRFIIDELKKYFNFIFMANNIFIKNKLSDLTKEEIFDFCTKYSKERDFIIETLNKYLKWGVNEQKLRNKLLDRLGVKQKKILEIKKFKIHIKKHNNNYTINIKDLANNSRLIKEMKSINTYPDFLNAIDKNKVSELVIISGNQLKILFQFAHFNIIEELKAYIDFKILLLKTSILNTPLNNIKEAYKQSDSKSDFIIEKLSVCKKEIDLRQKYKDALKKELSEFEERKGEIVKRIKAETKVQEACIFKINRYLVLLKKLGAEIEQNANLPVEKVALNKVEDEISKDISLDISHDEENKDQLNNSDKEDFLTKEISESIKMEIENNTAKADEFENDVINIIDSVEMDNLEEYDEEDLTEMSKNIEKISNTVQFNAEDIFKTLEGKDEQSQEAILTDKLEKIEDTAEKLDTASLLLIKSSAALIIEKTKTLLQNSKVDKFKMLLALYEVLDKKKDYELKIKILDEFCKHLEEKHPKVYLQLKYLLKIQREKILQEKILKGNKISEIWETINAIDKVESKIEYLNNLLQDDKWNNHHSFIQSIINGFITTDIKELFKETDQLPANEQLDILNKINQFRDDFGNNEEIAHEILLKTLELNARKKLLADSTNHIFDSDTMDLFTIAGSDADELLNSIDLAILNAEQEKIISEFRENNISEEEIEKYKEEYQKKIQSNKQTEKTVQKQSKKETIMRIPKITGLKDAQKFLGFATGQEEEKLVSDIEELLKENKLSEANSVIKAKVYWECVKIKDYRKMSRLLSSLENNDLISSSNELNKQVQNYIQSLEPVIMETAKEKIEELKQKANNESLQIVEEVYNDEEQKDDKKHIIDTIFESFKKLVYFKDPIKIADENGLNEDEMKKLPQLIEKYQHEGKFIYLPVHKEILGVGKLKFIIEKAYMEHMEKIPIDIDILKVKEAWDIVRAHKELIYQFELLGVSNKKERNEIYKKLQILIKPEGAKVSKEIRPVKHATEQKTEPVKQATEQKTEPVNRKEISPIPQKVKKPRISENKSKKELKKNISTKRKIISGENIKNEYNQKMKKLVEKSFAPIIIDYIKNMYKNKKRKDFVMVANGRRQYYTKDILKGVVEEILKRDSRGKSHSVLLDSIKDDKALFDSIVNELFIKKKTKDGIIAYFPKCLKK